MMGTSNHHWRVLAVFCHPKSETVKGNGPIDELLGSPVPHLEVTARAVGLQLSIKLPALPLWRV